MRTETYGEALDSLGAERLTVYHPTSRAALGLVRRRPEIEVRPTPGFLVGFDAFAAWRRQRRGLLLEDFYRWVRQNHDLLMDGGHPCGGRWNLDSSNRLPPPEQTPWQAPWQPEEDDIDAEVREDLDRWEREDGISFVGRDGPRLFACTRDEALIALREFVQHRLPTFGAYEDAVLSADPWMSHSTLSVPLNLGLLHPAECVDAAERAYRAGAAPLNSVEGFVRQIAGWREYVWQLYWHFGPQYQRSNVLEHRQPLPDWFLELDAEATEARCLGGTLAQIRDRGWVHHIPRLMVLGSWALQRAWDPAQLTDWFHRAFVDGYDWVMLPNVLGMSQYADGGRMTTKPYTSAGAYLNRMTDYCTGCRFRPSSRTGPDACPFTCGYWHFVDAHRDLLRANPRTARTVHQADRLADLDETLAEHRRRFGAGTRGS